SVMCSTQPPPCGSKCTRRFVWPPPPPPPPEPYPPPDWFSGWLSSGRTTGSGVAGEPGLLGVSGVSTGWSGGGGWGASASGQGFFSQSATGQLLFRAVRVAGLGTVTVSVVSSLPCWSRVTTVYVPLCS